MRLFAPIVFGVMTACSTPAPPEPIVVTQEVRVPVAVPCIDPDDIPPERLYADQRLEPTSDIEAMLDALLEGITERDQDIPGYRAALKGCATRADRNREGE